MERAEGGELGDTGRGANDVPAIAPTVPADLVGSGLASAYRIDVVGR